MGTLRGPQREGSARLDEGKLTEAVVAAYSGEDGSRGAEAADKIRPARLRLWSIVESCHPKQLAEALRAAASNTKDHANRYGLGALRAAFADFIAPPPRCGRCGVPYVRGKICSGPASRSAREGRRNPHCYLDRVRKADRGLSPLRDPAFKAAHDVAEKAIRAAKPKLKFLPDPEILVDRTMTILSKICEESQHSDVKASYKEIQKLLADGVQANGRLILKVQLQHYAAAGAISRADLIQGGALGCRRALLDFDSRNAGFASYAIAKIRRGCLTVWESRNVVVTPDEHLSRRRQVEAAGVSPQALYNGILDAKDHHYETLLSALAPVLVGEVLLHEMHLDRVVTQSRNLTLKRQLSKIADWAARRIDESTVRRLVSPKGKAERGRREIQKRVPLRGPGLLSALKYGHLGYVSLSGSAEEAESDGLGRHGIESVWEPLEDSDPEKVLLSDRQTTALELALEELKVENAEMHEVLIRRHGFGGQEEETFESIGETGLRCTGRKTSRQNITNLLKKGEQRLRVHLQSLGWVDVVPATPVPEVVPLPQPPKPIELLREVEAYGPSIVFTSAEAESWSSFRSEVDSIAW